MCWLEQNGMGLAARLRRDGLELATVGTGCFAFGPALGLAGLDLTTVETRPFGCGHG